MEDVDLRQLRYFCAVAEHGTFHAAARHLGMTQPALSRAVRRLETSLGTQLLSRGHSGTTLTPSGHRLLAETRNIDQQLRASLRRAIGPDDVSDVLRASAPGCDVDLLAAIGRTGGASLPPVRVQPVVSQRSAQVSDVVSGRTDLAILRLPFDATGLATQLYLTEPRMLLVSSDHAWSQREEIDLHELEGESFPVWADCGLGELAYWSGTDTGTHRWTTGPTIVDAAQFAAVIRLGQAVGLLAQSLLDHLPGDGLASVAVRGLSPSEVHLAWAEDSTDSALARLVYATR